ncbi:MAG: helix-turn-helix domain-containing protein [Chthoniobacterales bacterium]
MIDGRSRWGESWRTEETGWKIFGANVRRERVARDLSQEVLAELCALHVRTIAKIEAGELPVRASTVTRLQKAIGCPLVRLLQGTGSSQARGTEEPSDLKAILTRLSDQRVTDFGW